MRNPKLIGAGFLISTGLTTLVVFAWSQWQLIRELLFLNRATLTDAGAVMLALPVVAIFLTVALRRART